jgi:hypothetical protein
LTPTLPTPATTGDPNLERMASTPMDWRYI